MKSVEDLDVFKLAHQLALKTYSTTKTLSTITCHGATGFPFIPYPFAVILFTGETRACGSFRPLLSRCSFILSKVKRERSAGCNAVSRAENNFAARNAEGAEIDTHCNLKGISR